MGHSKIDARTGNREFWREVSRVAEKDNLIVTAIHDPGHGDLDPAQENVEIVSKNYGCSNACLAEQDQANLVGDINGVVGGIPSNIMVLADSPNRS